jgi:protein-S-isoprenylcysteine O-methyltransferase Ste14
MKPSRALLDSAERLILCGLFSFFAYRMVMAFLHGGGAAPLLMMTGEAIVIAFVLLRPKTEDISVSPREWMIAFGATIAPLLVQAEVPQPPLVDARVCTIIIGFSLLAQIAAKMSLNLSFGIVPANRGVKSDGFYRLVRHPVYASYLIGHIGFLMLYPSPFNATVYAIALGLQIRRIFAEERLLSRDPAYREYQEVVRYRLLPGVF